MNTNGRSALFGVVSWCLFLGFYLLFAGNTGLSEIAAGAAAATVTLCLVRLLRQKFKRALQMKAVWFLLLLRIPFAMLSESWLLLTALLRQLRGVETEGHLIEHPFSCPEDGHDLARIAFMTFGVCITPNSYLVYDDRKNGRVLIRQLVGKDLSTVDRLFVELP